MISMKINRRIGKILAVVGFAVAMGVFACLTRFYAGERTFAEGDDTITLAERAEFEVGKGAAFEPEGAKFVTFYDDGKKLIVRTDAKTVEEALQRAEITLNTGDIVEPGLATEINADNYYINIYRARPVVVKDGLKDKYLMTASYDAKAIAREAGLTIYDGDEVALVPNEAFLETGVASTYEVSRNGGRTITEEVEIPFAEQTVKDASLDIGKSEVRQLGEVGMKRVYYEVQYVEM